MSLVLQMTYIGGDYQFYTKGEQLRSTDYFSKGGAVANFENHREIVHLALQKLPKAHQKAIVDRFWGCLTIDEIARRLRISWDEADRIIEEGLCLLKQYIEETNKIKEREFLEIA